MMGLQYIMLKLPLSKQPKNIAGVLQNLSWAFTIGLTYKNRLENLEANSFLFHRCVPTLVFDFDRFSQFSHKVFKKICAATSFK